jgi:hypothetical protein
MEEFICDKCDKPAIGITGFTTSEKEQWCKDHKPEPLFIVRG